MLSYSAYTILQNFVHSGHRRQKKVLRFELNEHITIGPKPEKPVAVLELACGGGNLASIFPPASYLGIDSAADRIAMARKNYPSYRFDVEEINDLKWRSLVRDFDFVFCHALLHHLNDEECQRLFHTIKSESRKPATFVAIEPILPLFRRNPVGYLLAKMDEGKYIRSSSQWKKLLGAELKCSKRLDFFPRWPVNEEVYTFRFSV